jgi:hypothetical protein
MMPDWVNTTYIGASSYTCPSNGWVKVKVTSVQHVSAGFTINGKYFELAYSSGNYIDTGNAFIPVAKDDVVSCKGSSISYSFIPMKGVN